MDSVKKYRFFQKDPDEIAVVIYGVLGGAWIYHKNDWLDEMMFLDTWDPVVNGWKDISRIESIQALEKIIGRDFGGGDTEVNVLFQVIPVPVQYIFNWAKELEEEERENLEEQPDIQPMTNECEIPQTIFTLYLGEESIEDSGIFVSDDLIVIENLVDGEMPIDIYQNGGWATYDFDEIPEDLYNILENSNINFLLNEWHKVGLSFDELPEEIKAILKGCVPEEFLEDSEE